MDIDTNVHNKSYGLFYLKTGILFFWGLWFGIVFLSNLIDLLNVHYGVMINFKFDSGNYQAVEKVISIYNTPNYILTLLFHFNIIIQGVTAFLFLIAAVSFYRLKPYSWKFVNLAFAISIALWGVFMIMEEVFIAYQFEPTHMRLGMFEMISLLMFHLLQLERP